jgi:site-specific DNA recombinase
LLLESAKRGEFQGLVLYKGDRLGRTTLINERIAHDLYYDLGIQLIGVAETIDLSTETGRLLFTLNSALARMERANTLRRSRDATIRLAKEGVWLGIVPYGYRVAGKDKDARLRVSDEAF